MTGWILAIVIVVLETVAIIGNSGYLQDGKIRHGYLGYYTTLSNIVVWLYFLLVLLNKCFHILPFVDHVAVCFTVMMTITMTFLIYAFMLMPGQLKQQREGTLGWNVFNPYNMMVHFVCPLLVILYWFICADVANMKLYMSPIWLVSPTLYIGLCIIRYRMGLTIDDEGNRWPYGFMDVDKLGVAKVARNIGILTIGFCLLGLAIAAISKLMR